MVSLNLSLFLVFFVRSDYMMSRDLSQPYHGLWFLQKIALNMLNDG